MKNAIVAPLPNFTEHLIEEAPHVWSWGPPEKEKKRMHDILDAIMFLKSHGLRGAGAIRAYHARRVVLLMVHVVPLYRMTPNAQLDGAVLA